MQDRLVCLYKNDFTEKDWRTLSWVFDFNKNDSNAGIHVIINNEDN